MNFLWHRPTRKLREINTFIACLALVTLIALPASTQVRPGFTAGSLPPTDDDSAAANIGFRLNFFAANFDDLFVNNNGNITFGSPLPTFTPFGLRKTNKKIIAPFFSDVDTTGLLSLQAEFGTGTVDSCDAFAATWNDVGYFAGHDDLLNTFQVVLIDRSDIQPGDFDIELNHEQIEWETGDASGGSGGLGGFSARVGYSGGPAVMGRSFELAGSGVAGSLLDSNLTTGLINNSLDSGVDGRYRFSFRDGSSCSNYTFQIQPPQTLEIDGMNVTAGTFNLTSVTAFSASDGVTVQSTNALLAPVSISANIGSDDLHHLVDVPSNTEVVQLIGFFDASEPDLPPANFNITVGPLGEQCPNPGEFTYTLPQFSANTVFQVTSLGLLPGDELDNIDTFWTTPLALSVVDPGGLRATLDNGIANACGSTSDNIWYAAAPGSGATGIPHGLQPRPVCGDNVINPPIEQCEDGNDIEGDGCSNACQFENNWTFAGSVVDISGTISFMVNGVPISVPTQAGQDASTVAENVADAFNTDAALNVLEIAAIQNGAGLDTNGTVTNLSITDSGLVHGESCAPAVHDTFGRTGNLIGSSADTGHVWTGTGSLVTTDGAEAVVDGAAGMYATLEGLTFDPLTSYKLSADMELTSGGDFWIGLGFSRPTSDNPLDDTTGFYLRRENPAVQTFINASSGAEDLAVDGSFPDILEVNLITGQTVNDSYLVWSLNGEVIRKELGVDASGLDGVFLANNFEPSLQGTVEDFAMCVPEPGLLSLLGPGCIGLLGLARRRRSR